MFRLHKYRRWNDIARCKRKPLTSEFKRKSSGSCDSEEYTSIIWIELETDENIQLQRQNRSAMERAP